MPTFRQAPFLPRALRSLLDQQLPDWELLVVDDASPDETPTVLAPFLGDARIRALRLERNVGTGRPQPGHLPGPGRYIAYLPSDDVYFHSTCSVSWRTWRAPVYLAYGGLCWGPATVAPPCRGGSRGRGAGRLSRPYPGRRRWDSPAGTCWPSYRCATAGSGRGCAGPPGGGRHRPPGRTSAGPPVPRGPFAYGGAVTCHWVDHPDQQHKIIGWGRIDNAPGAVLGDAGRGQAAYRAYYGVSPGEYLNWRPSAGGPFDEAYAYAGPAAPATCPPRGATDPPWPASWASTPSASWPSRSGGTSCSASGCATRFWDAGPLPFGNIEESHSRGLAGAGAGRPP